MANTLPAWLAASPPPPPPALGTCQDRAVTWEHLPCSAPCPLIIPNPHCPRVTGCPPLPLLPPRATFLGVANNQATTDWNFPEGFFFTKRGRNEKIYRNCGPHEGDTFLENSSLTPWLASFPAGPGSLPRVLSGSSVSPHPPSEWEVLRTPAPAPG